MTGEIRSQCLTLIRILNYFIKREIMVTFQHHPVIIRENLRTHCGKTLTTTEQKVSIDLWNHIPPKGILERRWLILQAKSNIPTKSLILLNLYVFFFFNFQNCYHLFRCFKMIGIKYTILTMDIRLAVIFAICVFQKIGH